MQACYLYFEVQLLTTHKLILELITYRCYCTEILIISESSKKGKEEKENSLTESSSLTYIAYNNMLQNCMDSKKISQGTRAKQSNRFAGLAPEICTHYRCILYCYTVSVLYVLQSA